MDAEKYLNELIDGFNENLSHDVKEEFLQDFAVIGGNIDDAISQAIETVMEVAPQCIAQLVEAGKIPDIQEWMPADKQGYRDYVKDYIHDVVFVPYISQALCYCFFNDFYFSYGLDPQEIDPMDVEKVEQLAFDYTADDDIEDFIFWAKDIFGLLDEG